MVLYKFTKHLLGCQRIASHYRYLNTTGVSYKIVQFYLSDIGEGIREVTVNEWFVKLGDKVNQFDNICVVESDKASVNITSRYDGIIKKLYYDVGDKALVGKPLVDIDTDDVENDTSTSESDSHETKKDQESIFTQHTFSSQPSSISNVTSGKPLTTPAVRRIAMEYGIQLVNIQGTGKSGRIMKEDILNHLKKTSSDKSSDSAPKTPSTVADLTPITGIRRAMFNSMTQSNLIPSFNFCEEVDVSKLIRFKDDIKAHYEKKNVKITYMPFFIKALSNALNEFPELNASLDANHENLIVHKEHNVAFAVDSKGGLVVPNVKNVQTLTVVDIAKELSRILEKGKEGFFNPADLKDGTITISNVGMIGGTYTRPLILPPQLVIVALGKIIKRPVFNHNDELTKANILYTSWAADHRVIDGATLAKFVELWKYYLENPSVLCLDI